MDKIIICPYCASVNSKSNHEEFVTCCYCGKEFDVDDDLWQ